MKDSIDQYLLRHGLSHGGMAKLVGKHRQQVQRWIRDSVIVEWDGRTGKPTGIYKEQRRRLWP